MSPISIRCWTGKTLIFFAIAVEIFLCSYLWRRSTPKIRFGFIVKEPANYLVVWKQGEDPFRYVSSNTLHDALHYANDELGLVQGHNPLPEQELEHLWLSDRYGSYILLWKLGRIPSLNQLTFQRLDDAEYFARAFRKGSYSMSPFGHSILLRPLSRSN